MIVTSARRRNPYITALMVMGAEKMHNTLINHTFHKGTTTPWAAYFQNDMVAM